jgi:hypothetical protein
VLFDLKYGLSRTGCTFARIWEKEGFGYPDSACLSEGDFGSNREASGFDVVVKSASEDMLSFRYIPVKSLYQGCASTARCGHHCWQRHASPGKCCGIDFR